MQSHNEKNNITLIFIHSLVSFEITYSHFTLPFLPFLRRRMSPPAPAADSGDIRRDAPDEINGFHNDKIVTHSTPPSNPPSFPGGAFVIIPPEILRRVVVASGKGFSIGAGIKGGLALFAILARFARKKPPR